MPDITGRRRLAAQLRSEQRIMRPTPSTDCFVRNHNATLKDHFLNFTQTVVEAEIQPECSSHDRDWKAMLVVR